MVDLILLERQSLKELLHNFLDDVNKGYFSIIEHLKDQQTQFNNYFTVLIEKIKELNKEG